jgi:hypothetical protein
MPIYRCSGCEHSTNTTFVELIADRGPNACTVVRCVGRYVPDAVNVVERGCAYDTASNDVRDFVDYAIAHNGVRAAIARGATPRTAPCVTVTPDSTEVVAP